MGGALQGWGGVRARVWSRPAGQTRRPGRRGRGHTGSARGLGREIQDRGRTQGAESGRTREGCRRGDDPAREGRAEATHCGHQVLQGPTEPHSPAETQLQVLQGGAEGWGSPGLVLPRGSRPLGSFTRPLGFCPPSRGQLCSPHTLPCGPLRQQHTLRPVRTHLWTRVIPCLCPWHVSRRTEPSSVHMCPSLLFGLCPTVISCLLYTGHDFYHFTHSPGGRSCNKSGWTFGKPEQRPAPCRRQEEAESRVWNPEPAIPRAPRCPHTQACGGQVCTRPQVHTWPSLAPPAPRASTEENQDADSSSSFLSLDPLPGASS